MGPDLAAAFCALTDGFLSLADLGADFLMDFGGMFASRKSDGWSGGVVFGRSLDDFGECGDEWRGGRVASLLSVSVDPSMMWGDWGRGRPGRLWKQELKSRCSIAEGTAAAICSHEGRRAPISDESDAISPFSFGRKVRINKMTSWLHWEGDCEA